MGRPYSLVLVRPSAEKQQTYVTRLPAPRMCLLSKGVVITWDVGRTKNEDCPVPDRSIRWG